MTPDKILQKVINMQAVAALLLKDLSELRNQLEGTTTMKPKKQGLSDEQIVKLKAKMMKKMLSGKGEPLTM